MSGGKKAVRIEESRQEVDHLEGELARWFEHRRARDVQGQYRTQLAHLETVLRSATREALERLGHAEAEPGHGRVYELCRENDQRLTFVRRLWSWFREKWDQRDDAALDRLLRSAEEVVWSCYAEPLRRAGCDLGPAPLPYVDPHYSAHATTRRDPPASVKSFEHLFEAALVTLPVPVVGIPPVCERRPWWLAVLAHESGHQVEHDLGEHGIGSAVKAVVQAAADPDGADAAWTLWAPEIFADAFAAAAIGSAHAWVLNELELATPAAMLTNSRFYPPRVVRRELLGQTLAALGLAPDRAVPPLEDVPAPAELAEAGDAKAATVERRFGRARDVAEALVRAPLPPAASLPSLFGWDAASYQREGRIDRWRRRWLAADPIVAETDVRTPREAIAGAVAAWTEVAAVADEGRRREVTAVLGERVLDTLPECREDGVRAAAPQAMDIEAVADRFVADLFSVPVTEA